MEFRSEGDFQAPPTSHPARLIQKGKLTATGEVGTPLEINIYHEKGRPLFLAAILR